MIINIYQSQDNTTTNPIDPNFIEHNFKIFVVEVGIQTETEVAEVGT
jgi:hypothetical protein